jgi:hypothetical protein
VSNGLFIALRLLFFGFWYFTSLYAILTYVPFTSTHVIEAGILPSLATFTRLHRWLAWGPAAAVLLTSWRDVRRGGLARAFALVYATTLVAAGAYLVARPVLPHLRCNDQSLYWGLAALAPPLLLSILDHAVTARSIEWSWPSTREDRAVFSASAACLAIAFLTYAATFHVRALGGLGFDRRDELVGLGLSFLLHVSFVGAAFITWCLLRAVATFAREKAVMVEHLLVAAVMLALFALLARNVVFTAISLRERSATVVAFAWATAVVSTVSGVAWRCADARGRPVRSGLRLFFTPLSAPHASTVVRVGALAAAAALAIFLQVQASKMDVNGLMQRLCACASWILIFAASLAAFRKPARQEGGTVALLFAACLGVVAYRGWRSYGRPGDRIPTLEKIAAADPSYGLLFELSGAGGRTESMSERFELMQRSTGFPIEHPIAPLDFHFAANLGTAVGVKPHVFVIVIDSLRRDYLSPFNPKVTFTPSIEKFASTSDVFVNAFTHYGATGLSEPSIWVGGMMPHKQYISPFMPMNSLEKLLLAEHYERMVSVDSILAQILDRSSIVPLDDGRPTGEYDLCETLEELRAKVDVRRKEGVRMFAYTQAQNIHVSTIAREGVSIPPGVHYDGFYDPYAWRLNRVDTCFGAFIEYLQSTGLYDESIVVFTADHGDLLGEEGRWGHAYNLNPEVVRIPLIIHRPTTLRSGLSVDTKRVAFSTDIAPSLYRLLGYMPTTLGGGFGQSLYGPRGEDREWHMLVSSYGPVYGILEDGGKRLYVADAVNYTDTYYDVQAGSNAPRDGVPEDVRTRDLERIAAGIADLHETFHVEQVAGAKPAPPAGAGSAH